MERCYNTEALNKHLEEEENHFAKEETLEDKARIVEEKFTEMANGPDGIDHAFYWLGGVFNEELMDAAISYLFGDGNNKNFEDAVEAKAQELLDADCSEPEPPEND